MNSNFSKLLKPKLEKHFSETHEHVRYGEEFLEMFEDPFIAAIKKTVREQNEHA